MAKELAQGIKDFVADVPEGVWAAIPPQYQQRLYDLCALADKVQAASDAS